MMIVPLPSIKVDVDVIVNLITACYSSIRQIGNNVFSTDMGMSCLLDATYRTTKYPLPLYFLVVKTNMEYKVVASFVTQSETTDTIKEALSVIMKWNPEWAPKHFR